MLVGKLLTWFLIVFMICNVAVSCIALVRYDERGKGVVAENSIQKWADEHYDLVILDTPPVLAVTDAAVAVRVAATSLLVARFGKTSLKEMENCIKRLQQMGACIKGTVLNDVVKSAALYYHSGYGLYEYGHSTTRQPRKD